MTTCRRQGWCTRDPSDGRLTFRGEPLIGCSTHYGMKIESFQKKNLHGRPSKTTPGMRNRERKKSNYAVVAYLGCVFGISLGICQSELHNKLPLEQTEISPSFFGKIYFWVNVAVLGYTNHNSWLVPRPRLSFLFLFFSFFLSTEFRC